MKAEWNCTVLQCPTHARIFTCNTVVPLSAQYYKAVLGYNTTNSCPALGADESPNFLSTRRCDHPKKCEFFKFLSCATSSVELLIIRNLIQYCGLRIASHHHITWEQSV
ncbi:hypothetical protein Y032_0250g157 [Ancylostoma ceylanicum]|uniref:Uncharacterized protein n=1 Tax=Ancylostoma ceylanicum TaxID=53326 RepID=A0A016SD94_9BILA|nr:hypothetical protein Y032_0250g157 [Ancylostoma ceylanicum]